MKEKQIINLSSNKEVNYNNNDDDLLINHSTNFESEDCIVTNGKVEFDQIDFIKNALYNHFLFKGLDDEIM